MDIGHGITLVDLALFYKKHLILGDLQLGSEGVAHNQGFFLPKFQLQDILERLSKIFTQVKAEFLIINGDLKHAIGTILDQEWTDILAFFDFALQHVQKIIIVRGNHDLVIDPIAAKRNIAVVESYRVGDMLIFHGHKVVKETAPLLVVGHEHPAVSFKDKPGDKYKCYLVGKWKKSILIVMPSFNPLTEGSDITRDRFLSPYLKPGIGTFDVYVVEDKIYPFGKVQDLR
ncbi:metallophosphoesterase [Candidatus Woesearchaeota archaeon]|nr:metallophosphoesterase [Candidatus Woesearchaeota archaeon]